MDATLLRPPPYRDPERLVMIDERTERSPKNRVAPLSSRPFGVRPLDPVTFASDTVLPVIGAVSVAGPAWRAARIDPALALRDE